MLGSLAERGCLMRPLARHIGTFILSCGLFRDALSGRPSEYARFG